MRTPATHEGGWLERRARAVPRLPRNSESATNVSAYTAVGSASSGRSRADVSINCAT